MTERQGSVEIRRIYIKDLSFESPHSIEGTGKEWNPEVNLNINLSSNNAGQGIYEAAIRCTLTARNNKKVAYVIEVDQAGVFAVTGLDEQHTKAVLATFCPNLLFPYVRETVDSLLAKGGFPVVNLAPINFDQLYAESQQKEDNAVGNAEEKPVIH